MAEANSSRARSGMAFIRSLFQSEYVSWKCMRSRCANKGNASWKYYGARGVTVCDRWADFWLFFCDMGPKPTTDHQIERRENSVGYEPGNCCWATPHEQQRNTVKCRMLEHAGESLCVADWEKRTGIPSTTIVARLNRFGWSVSDALSVEPVMGRNRWDWC